ncbi:MAG: hypothetical protein ABSB59_07325 [Streptosporangiaceae bacterium]|jgi:hypothetical protein
MDEAQAIPANLYFYADQTTQANEALQTWIRAKFAPAVELYRQTAIDFGDDIEDLTLASTVSIDVSTMSCLTQLAVTDRQVHVVGQAFQEAGDSGIGSTQMPGYLRGHPDPGGDPVQYDIVTASDATIGASVGQIDGAARRAAQQQGQQLARYIAQHGVDSYVLAQLKAHQDDPVYMAALLNSLTPAQLQDFLKHFADNGNGSDNSTLIAALIAGYESGSLGKSAANTIANWLLDTTDTDQMGMTLQFLAGIQADPAAARNFVDSLTDAQFTQFANGLYFYSGEPDGMAEDYSGAFLDVCAAALAGLGSEAEMRALMDRVVRIYTQTHPSEMSTLLQPLTDLLASFETQCFAHPPVFTGTPNQTKSQQLDAWIKQQAGIMAGYAATFSQWIFTTDNSNANEAAFQRGYLEGLLISGVVAFLPSLTGLQNAMLAMGESAITGWLQPQLDGIVQNWESYFGSDDAQKQQNAFLAAEVECAKFELALQLFGENQLVIWRDGHEVPITLENTGCTNDDQLLTWVLEHDDQVVLTGTDGQTTLDSLLSQVGNAFSAYPQAPGGT